MLDRIIYSILAIMLNVTQLGDRRDRPVSDCGWNTTASSGFELMGLSLIESSITVHLFLEFTPPSVLDNVADCHIFAAVTSSITLIFNLTNSVYAWGFCQSDFN